LLAPRAYQRDLLEVGSLSWIWKCVQAWEAVHAVVVLSNDARVIEEGFIRFYREQMAGFLGRKALHSYLHYLKVPTVRF